MAPLRTISFALLGVFVALVHLPALAENFLPACENVDLEVVPDPIKVDCGVQAQKVLEFPGELEDFEKIVKELGVNETRDRYNEFFVDLREHLRKSVEENHFQTKSLIACLKKDKEALLEMGYRSNVAETFLNDCPALLSGLKKQVSDNWSDMRSGLEIGWGTDLRGSLSGGNWGFPKLKLTFEGIPYEGDGRKKHFFAQHLGHDFEGELAPLSEQEKLGLNELVYQELKEKIITAGFHSQSFPEESNKKNPFTRELFFELEEKHQANPTAKINELKRLIRAFPSDRAPAGLATLWDVDDQENGGGVTEKYRQQYFDALSRAPLLGYVSSPDPTDEELLKALSVFEEGSQDFLKRLDPDSDDRVNLQELAAFLPLINSFLEDRPSYCGYAKTWLEENREREEGQRLKSTATGLGLGALCLGSLAFTHTGAPLLACSGGALYGGYEYHQARLQSQEVASSTTLNIERLEAADFSTLNEAKQEEYLAAGFLALDAFGAGADGLRLLGQARRVSRLPNPRSVSSREVDDYGMESFLKRYKWKTKGAGRDVQEQWTSGELALPENALNRLKAVRKFSTTRVLDAPTFNKKNPYTSLRGVFNQQSKILRRTPEMRAPHIRAIEKFSDTGAWTDYFENFTGEVFTRMLKSGDPKLVGAANEGKLSKKVILEIFSERFAERGLTISEIPPDSGLLKMKDFRKYLKKGPLWDRALDGQNGLASHGEFPHLFQLDYVLDDMLKASDGEIKSYQEFFDYWSTADGLNVWNDSFDLFKQTHTLRATGVITEKYLGQFGMVD